MAIPIYDKITGSVAIKDFDRGIFQTMGALPDPTDPTNPCYKLSVVNGATTIKVPVYFGQPESIFVKKVFPFITVTRGDMEPAMHRWMGVGQLEYRAGVPATQVMRNGVSGFAEYQRKVQAWPFDIPYTISIWDRYEGMALHAELLEVLKAFQPVGRLIVYDSLSLRRSYEYYWEGGIVNLQELVDPVTRVRGYAITIRVEGELDLNEPTTMGSVSGVDLSLYQF